MERLKNKIINMEKMIFNLEKSIDKLNFHSDPDDIEYVQDSVVARFKILVDYSWKALKVYLEYQGLSDISGAPKDVLKTAKDINFLNQGQYEVLIKSLTLRNMAAHVYDQKQYVLAIEMAPITLDAVKSLIVKLQATI
jgi:nucleotidyltransferase substrate binding protein (TIGR01987 family)